MNTMTPAHPLPLHALDEHGRILLGVERDASGLRVDITVPPGEPHDPTNPVLLKRLLGQMSFACGRQLLDLKLDDPYHAHVHLAASQKAKLGQLRIKLNTDAFAQVDLDSAPPRYEQTAPRITTSECRLAGESSRFRFYPRDAQMLSEPHLVASDFHTHNSGELSGREMLDIAREQGVPYPVRLLEELNIDAAEMPIRLTTVERVFFPPLDQGKKIPKEESAVRLDELLRDHPQTYDRLAQAMDARWDRQSIFKNMEVDLYRPRYPVSKFPQLVVPQLNRIGENYAKNHIRYAEITTVGLDKPEMLTAVHQAIAEVKERCLINPHDPTSGVDERFLIGVPRTFDNQQIARLFERTKAMAASPAVMGIDILGYETNPTSHLLPHLRDLAKWAMANGHEDFTFRVHAGENSKNPDNVYQVLKLAEETGCRVRIGHAIYGLDEQTLDLAQKLARQAREQGKKMPVVFEFNMPSNIALNNIDNLDLMPFIECRRRGIPFVVSKDGAGIMSATSTELHLLLKAAGFTPDDFRELAHTEHALIEEQLDYSRVKVARIAHSPEFKGNPSAFMNGLVAKLETLPKVEPQEAIEKPLSPQAIERRDHLTGNTASLCGKVPIMLVGASGTTWESIAPKNQLEAAAALDMLVHALDPEKVYFAHGRAKKEGVTGQLATSLQMLEAQTGRKFHAHAVMTHEAAAEALEAHELAPHIDSLTLIDGTRMNIPRALMSVPKNEKGIMIGVGGSDFSRGAYLEAHHHDVPLYLMDWVEGASQDKAHNMWPGYGVADAQQLLLKLSKDHPELFVNQRALTEGEVKQLHAESQQRVNAARNQEHLQRGGGPGRFVDKAMNGVQR